MKIRKIQKSLGQYFDEQGLEVVIEGEDVFIGSEPTGYSYITAVGIQDFIAYVQNSGKRNGFSIFPIKSTPTSKSGFVKAGTKVLSFPKGVVFNEEELKQLKEME